MYRGRKEIYCCRMKGGITKEQEEILCVISLTVVMVSQIYNIYQNSSITNFKYVQLIVC